MYFACRFIKNTMELQEEIEGKVVLLSFIGNFLGETDGVIVVDAINDYITDGYTDFVVDMQQLEHINSAGLSVLITVSDKIKKVEGTLILTQMNERVLKLFKITKLDTVFKIENSTREVVKKLNT
ncbi:MAG: STAS domain-containing protein [Bacteroidia bacterium]|nr:STAS domain-containing protein [Bacteroidia bacterium]MDW8346344.1 STAS domain-containing protein [Bacteroidia bacterium]